VYPDTTTIEYWGHSLLLHRDCAQAPLFRGIQSVSGATRYDFYLLAQSALFCPTLSTYDRIRIYIVTLRCDRVFRLEPRGAATAGVGSRQHRQIARPKGRARAVRYPTYWPAPGGRCFSATDRIQEVGRARLNRDLKVSGYPRSLLAATPHRHACPTRWSVPFTSYWWYNRREPHVPCVLYLLSPEVRAPHTTKPTLRAIPVCWVV